MATFQKRALDPARVAAAESAAAVVPFGGDPRAHATVEEATPTTPAVSERRPGYRPGNVYEVPVEEIKSNPFNPRVLYTTSAIDDMGQSLRQHGQKISATGYLDPTGRVVLIEGETRLRGARSAGLATLRIEIKDKPPSDRALYEEARAANVERRDQTPLDDALKWRELLDRKVYETQVSLAQALSLREDDVSRVLALGQLGARIINAVADHPELLTLRMLNAIREFAKVKGEQETLELILEASDKGWGYRDVESRRKAAEAGPVLRKRAATEHLTFGSAKGEIKTFDKDGRLELVLKGLTQEQSESLTESIKALLKGDEK